MREKGRLRASEDGAREDSSFQSDSTQLRSPLYCLVMQILRRRDKVGCTLRCPTHLPCPPPEPSCTQARTHAFVMRVISGAAGRGRGGEA